MLPSLVCVPMGCPLQRQTMVSYPAIDLAPAVARAIAAGRTIDLSRVSEGRLQTALAVEAAGVPEARALAWQGRLTFVGAADGLEKLVISLSGTGRAEAYLNRHRLLIGLRRRQRKFVDMIGDLKRAKAAESNGYGHLFFPDTEETVPASRIPDYVRERVREPEGALPPFGFPVERIEWGICEGDLRIELDRHGRNEFDLEAVILRSLTDFGPEAREGIVEERRLWRIVGRWLEDGAGNSAAFAVDLSRWNAMQRLRSERVLRDVIVPTCEPINREVALRWCRGRADLIGREIQEALQDWPCDYSRP
jgi:hypothetical protein